MINHGLARLITRLHDRSEKFTLENLKAAILVGRDIEDNEDQAILLNAISRRLARIKEWGLAKEIARSITASDRASKYEKVDALRGIGWMLALEGERDQATKLLNEARSIAEDMEQGWQQAELLCRIAKTLILSGDHNSYAVLDQAVISAQFGEWNGDLQDSGDSSGVLWETAEVIALNGDIEKARKIASEIRDFRKRSGAIEGVERIARSGVGSCFDDAL